MHRGRKYNPLLFRVCLYNVCGIHYFAFDSEKTEKVSTKNMYVSVVFTSTSPLMMKPISLVPIFGVMITSPRANVAGLRRGSTIRTNPVTWGM